MPAAAACRQAMVDAGGVATGKKKTKTLQFPFLKEKTFFGRRRREGHPIDTDWPSRPQWRIQRKHQTTRFTLTGGGRGPGEPGEVHIRQSCMYVTCGVASVSTSSE